MFATRAKPRLLPAIILQTILQCTLLLLSVAGTAHATKVKDLQAEKTYRVKSIDFHGNKIISDSDLLRVMTLKVRPWYTPWRSRPELDPAAFSDDLKQIKTLYDTRGYYNARVSYDLKIEGDLVTPIVSIDEDGRVRVSQITIITDDHRLPPDDPIYAHVPFKVGDPFSQDAYQKGASTLEKLYLDAGYGHAKVERSAQVDTFSNQARVTYRATQGVETVFGETKVEGNKSVDAEIVSRELAYNHGERFSEKLIDRSRDQILKLQLFSAVTVIPEQSSPQERVMNMIVHVREKPPRTIRVSLGYSTETQVGGEFEWRHYNWFGNGRQLSLLGRYSNITSTAAISLLQPHFFERNTAGSVSLRYEQDDEDTYLLTAVRFLPRLEHHFTKELSVFITERVERDRLNHLAKATFTALGGIRRKGLLSGPSIGATWNNVENPLDAKQGAIITLTADSAEKQLGSDYRFYKLSAEVKKYDQIPLGFTLATRFKIGTGDSIGANRNYPLFERFFSGGEGSVRGYGRRQLGPRSICPPPPPPGLLPPLPIGPMLPPPLGGSGNQQNNQQQNTNIGFVSQGKCNVPIGGLSLVESSVELRHEIYSPVSAAVFLDVGQVALRPYDPPFGHLRLGFGPAIIITTPIGPVRLDVGFPDKAPRGQPHWQVYFSIGQFF